MKFYWAARTRASRVAWMLEETGVEYERVVVPLGGGMEKTDTDFGAASPMGKVPALVDGEVHLADSAAICLYLADRYAGGRLAPGIADGQRGSFLYWMVFTPGVIEPAMAEKVGGWEPNRTRNGWGDFPTMIETLENALADDTWLVGGKFSAADVMVGSSCAFMRMFGLLPESKTLHDYADRCLSRPAYQRAMALEPPPES